MADYFISKDCRLHKFQNPKAWVNFEQPISNDIISISDSLDDKITWKKLAEGGNTGYTSIVVGITSEGELIEFGQGYRDRRYPNFYGEKSWERQGGSYTADLYDNNINKFISFANPEEGGTWQDVSAGKAHCLALSSNGDVYAWGATNAGQVGNGTRTPIFYKRLGVGSIENSKVSGVITHSRNLKTKSYISNNLPQLRIVPYEPDGVVGSGCEFDTQWCYYLSAYDINGSISGSGDYLKLSTSGTNIVEQPLLQINQTIHGKFFINDIIIRNSGNNYSNLNFIFSKSAVKYPTYNISLDSGSLSSISVTDGGIFDEIPSLKIVGDGQNASVDIVWTYSLEKISCDILTGGQHGSGSIHLEYESLSDTGTIAIDSSGIYAYITGIDITNPGSGYYNCMMETYYGLGASTEDMPIITSFSEENSQQIVYPTSGSISGEKIFPELNFIYSTDEQGTIDFNIQENNIIFSTIGGPCNNYSVTIATSHMPEPVRVVSNCDYIAATDDTSYALSKSKQLYFWGAAPNSTIQDNENRIVPYPIQNIQYKKPIVSYATVSGYKYETLSIDKITKVSGSMLMITEDNIAYSFDAFKTQKTAPYIWSYDIDLPEETLISNLINPSLFTSKYSESFLTTWSGMQNKIFGLKIIDAGAGYDPQQGNFTLILEDPTDSALKIPSVSTEDYLDDPIYNQYFDFDEFVGGGDIFPSLRDDIRFQNTANVDGKLDFGNNTPLFDSSLTLRTISTRVGASYTVSTDKGYVVQKTSFPAEFRYIIPVWTLRYKIIQRIINANGSVTNYDGGGIGMFKLIGLPNSPFNAADAPINMAYLAQSKDFINVEPEQKPIDKNFLVSNIAGKKEDLAPLTTGLNYPGIPLLVLDQNPRPEAPRYSSTLLSRLSGIVVEKGGYGFRAPPNVHILGETKSTNTIIAQEAEAEAIIEGPIEIKIIDGGYNYSKAPILKFIGNGIPPSIESINLDSAGSISSIIVKDSGLYGTEPSITLEYETFKDGNGRSANLEAILNGSVKYIKLIASGINYQYAPQIIVDTANNHKIPNLYNDLIAKQITMTEYEASLYTATAQSTLARERRSDGGAGFEVSGLYSGGWGPFQVLNVNIQKPFPTYDAKNLQRFSSLTFGCPVYLYTCDDYNLEVGYVESKEKSRTLTDRMIAGFNSPGWWNSDENNDSPDDFVRMIRFSNNVNFDSGCTFYMPLEDQLYTHVRSLKNPRRTGLKYFTENQTMKNIRLYDRQYDWMRFGDGWDSVSGYIDRSFYTQYGYVITISGSGDLCFGFTHSDIFVFDSFNNRYAKYLTYDTISNRLDMNGYCLFLSDLKWNSAPTIVISDSRGVELNTSVVLENDSISNITIDNPSKLDINENAKIHITNGEILFDEALVTTLVDYDNKSGVTGVVIDNPGYGYFDGDVDVNIEHNTGSGLEIEIYLDKPGLPSSIAGIKILAAGENYSENPIISIQTKDRLYNNAQFIEKLNYELKKIMIDNLCESTKYYEEYIKAEPYQGSLYQTLPDFAGIQDYAIGDRVSYFIRHDGIESFVIGSNTGIFYDNVVPKFTIKHPYKYYEYDIPILESRIQSGIATKFGFLRYD